MTTHAATRGTTSRLRRESRNRNHNPAPISTENMIKPRASGISNKARAISTGMKVPKVGIPTMFRNNTTTKAPSGINTM